MIPRRDVRAVLAAIGACEGGQVAAGERPGILAADPSAVQFAAASPKENDMLIQLIHFTFADADVEKAEAMLRELRDASRKEHGVLGFDVARSQETPNVFALWEQYRDQASQDAHVATEHFERLVVHGVRTLAQQRDAEILHAI